MSRLVSRNVSYALAALFCLLTAVSFWAGCGSTSQSSSSNPATGNNPPTSGTQPGSGGSGGSSGSGGTSGSTGGSGGAGGSGGSGATSGAAYLYIAVAGNTARIAAYKIDSKAASLSEVPGSPFNQQGGEESGVVAVSKNFVYGSEVEAVEQTGRTTTTAFRADATTGGLTQIGTPVIIQPNGQALLFAESSGQNLYAVDQGGNILTYTINPDGSLTDTGSKLHVAGQVTSLAVSPNGQLAYAAVNNGSFKDGTLTDALVVLNRNASSGTLSVNHQVNSNQHLADLQFDTSGRYLLAISGGDDQISVYSVNNSTGDATPVAGSPFVVTTPPRPPAPPQYVRTFRLDPASGFVYVIESSEAQPNPESLAVFSFSEASGTLAPVQRLDMPNLYIPVSLVADQSLVFVVSEQFGTVAGTIRIFRRDANTGMLTDSGNTVMAQTPFGESAEMRF
jgi:6-phosphogluconolactonase (cycloisomerase 2 family)